MLRSLQAYTDSGADKSVQCPGSALGKGCRWNSSNDRLCKAASDSAEVRTLRSLPKGHSMPDGHSRQASVESSAYDEAAQTHKASAVAPRKFVVRPPTQAEQLVAASRTPKAPRGQRSQAVWPAEMANRPEVHASHSCFPAPSGPANLPAGHEEHWVAPLLALNPPALHKPHSAAATSLLKRPNWQGSQTT